MGRRCAFLPIALVGLVCGGPLVGAALGQEPDAYERVKVKDAGISLLVPDSFAITHWTRKNAKVFLENNPAMAEAGTTVESLLKQPLIAAIDVDGDGAPDRTIEVGIIPELDSISPLAARVGLTNLGFRDITAARRTVAGRHGVFAAFTRDLVRIDGVKIALRVDQYYLPARDVLVGVAFARRPDDAAYDETIKTVAKSLRVLH